MSSVAGILQSAEAGAHLLQFYDRDHNALIRNVSAYLGEGLKRGEGLAVIATRPHVKAFSHQLETDGFDTANAVREGLLVFRDAEETLARFMVDGKPDWELFEQTISALIRELRTKSGLRAYGEMVSVLWNSGQSAAAIRLEQFWNKLLLANGFQLFCSYQIDVFGKEFHPAVLDGLLCAHTHMVPAETSGDLNDAISQAMSEVLGPKRMGVKLPSAEDFQPSWAVVPTGERRVLWIRNSLPEYADEILTRARHYYHLAPVVDASAA